MNHRHLNPDVLEALAKLAPDEPVPSLVTIDLPLPEPVPTHPLIRDGAHKGEALTSVPPQPINPTLRTDEARGHRERGDMRLVYFVRDSATWQVKIGVTNNIERRLAQLNVGPASVHLLFCVAGGETMEKTLHRRFQRARGKGEWFSLLDEEILSVVAQVLRETPTRRLPKRQALKPKPTRRK